MLKLILLVCFTLNVLVDSVPLNELVNDVEGYIWGGKETDISQVPYHVAVLGENSYVCGGFIVSPTHVVTAADCLYYRGCEYNIRAGTNDRTKGGVIAKVKSIHTHPKFNSTTLDYDVAVLELATPLKLNDKTIKSIKLAAKEPSIGSVSLVSGWGGVDEDQEPILILKSVTIPIYNRTMCEAEYKKHKVTITPRMICAGDGRVGSENGDEGSALVYKNEVVGVVSFFREWEQDATASVYTNVAHPEILKFIKEKAKL